MICAYEITAIKEAHIEYFLKTVHAPESESCIERGYPFHFHEK